MPLQQWFGGDLTGIIGTHLSPEWDAPDRFHKHVQEYLSTAEYDTFIYLERREYDTAPYAEAADVVIPSYDGGIAVEEMDSVLDVCSTVHHIGLYWSECHRQTWEDVVESVYDDMLAMRRQTEYTVVFPTHCIADRDTLLSDRLESLEAEERVWKPPSYEAVKEELADYRDDIMRTMQLRDRGAEPRYDWRVDWEEHPTITWTLDPTPQEGAPASSLAW